MNAATALSRSNHGDEEWNQLLRGGDDDDDNDDDENDNVSRHHHYWKEQNKQSSQPSCRPATVLVMTGILLVLTGTLLSPLLLPSRQSSRPIEVVENAPRTPETVISSYSSDSEDNKVSENTEVVTMTVPPTVAPTVPPTVAPMKNVTATNDNKRKDDKKKEKKEKDIPIRVDNNVCLETPVGNHDADAQAEQRHRCLVQGRFGGAGAWMPPDQANNISFYQAERPGMRDWQGSFGWAWGHKDCPACALDSSLKRAEICHVMARLDIRSLFLVGDSLQATFCNSLGYIMKQKLWYLAGDVSSRIECSQDDLEGTKYKPFNVSFIYRRNDLLTTDSNPHCTAPTLPHPGNNGTERNLDINRCQKWIEDFNTTVKTLQQDRKRMLLILNAGAHIHKPDLFEAVATNLATWVQREFLDKGYGIAVWRNTPQGHYDCHNYKEPVSRVEYKATFGSDTWNLKHKQEKDFTWRFMQEYNEMSLEILQRISPCLRTLDVATATQLRPDHHKSSQDCLHYGEKPPVGPPLEWVRLLYTHLVTLADSASHDECFS